MWDLLGLWLAAYGRLKDPEHHRTYCRASDTFHESFLEEQYLCTEAAPRLSQRFVPDNPVFGKSGGLSRDRAVAGPRRPRSLTL